MTVCWTG